MLRIGIVAGEASGDYLAGSLIREIRRHHPDLLLEGIGGPGLEQQGCRILYPMEKLAVMGLVEVAGSFIELSRIRNRLMDHFTRNPPDVFIGIDAPDFNLKLERKLHQSGIKTVHYVSPTVWAWRSYRIKQLRQAVDLVLTLFPFEQEFYRHYAIPAVYVGHPLADQISLSPDKLAARRRLGLAGDKKIIALMPGSRRSEIQRLLVPFLQTADALLQQDQDLQFISSVLNSEAVNNFNKNLAGPGLTNLPVTVYQDRSHDVLEAADIVLLASGTITLEAMLFKRPMVVAYRMNWLTYRVLRALVQVKYVALPNLLADSSLVPECLQERCTAEILRGEVVKWLVDPAAVQSLETKFTALHKQLKLNASEMAAQAVLKLMH